MLLRLVGNLRQQYVLVHTHKHMQRSLKYPYNKCKKAQEGTEAQPQAHRNVHTFIHHPLVYTHRLAHKHKEVERKILGAPAETCSNEQWVCHLLWGRQILPSLCSKLDFLRMWACVSLLVTRPWHTLCAVKAGGGRDKVSADYPPSENPHAVWRSARGPLSFLSRSEYHYCQWIRLLPVVTVKTQWPWWCVKNIHHSMLHWKISQWGGAIISLGTAKPLRDLYLTRLAV